jgi:hypothetical protein
MKARRLFVVAIVGLLATMAVTVSPAAAAKPTAGPITVPVTSSAVAGATGLVTNATFTLQRFAVQNGQLVAVGTLTATVTDLAGNVIGTITQTVRLPVNLTGTCRILELTLGPIDLDLLGLQVHLDQVHLTIDAQSGPGQLLGNLLCAVAGLLDSGSPLALNQLVTLLNRILGSL